MFVLCFFFCILPLPLSEAFYIIQPGKSMLSSQIPDIKNLFTHFKLYPLASDFKSDVSYKFFNKKMFELKANTKSSLLVRKYMFSNQPLCR